MVQVIDDRSGRLFEPHAGRGGTVKFEIARSNSKKEPFFWRIVAANGQTLATSEMYTRKASCVSAIASIQKNAAEAKVVDLTAE